MPQSDEWERNTVEYINLVAERHTPSGTSRAEWIGNDQIISILNDLGGVANMNHTFFPGGGGLDLSGARLAVSENGCIELLFGSLTHAHVVRPASLQIERFPNDSSGEWTYFRLNLVELSPSGVYDKDESDFEWHSEELVELCSEGSLGRYDERAVWDSYDCPPAARLVTRYFRGAFVTFAKGSMYNADSSTYDGRHSLGGRYSHRAHPGKPEVSAEEFRRYIGRQVR